MNIRNILSIYTQLQSAPFAQRYLAKCYENQGLESERESYDNTYRLIYFIEHGQTFYEQVKHAPLSIQPILSFYGMAQLLKAALITKRPYYPESTSVLSHGVTSRKRKKQNYSFMNDEVKVQHKGLLSYAAEHLFHMEHFSKEKYTMDELLRRIPEMTDVYGFLDGPYSGYHIGNYQDSVLSVPISVLDDYYMTSQRFKTYMKGLLPALQSIEQSQTHLSIHLIQPFQCLHHPFIFTNLTNQSVFLPSERSLHEPLPEILCHYLIMYNLSMLSRYETEWWGDILHSYSSEDLVFIKTFLDISNEKIPILIADLLHSHTLQK